MALTGCGQVCKFFLSIFIVKFVLFGMAMFFGGVYLINSAEGPQNMDLKTKHFVFVTSVLIVLGMLVILTSAAGGYGACTENKVALGVFIGLMTCLMTLTIIAGILAFANIREFSNHLGEFYTTIYAQYLIKKDWIRAIFLKLVHNTFNCCGFGGTVQTIIQETDTCPQNYSLLGLSFSTSTNCLTAIMADLQASTVLGIFLGFAGIMLVVLGCSVGMYYSVKRMHYLPAPYF